MTIETQVLALTTATELLLTAVNTRKGDLYAAASLATNGAGAADASATASANSAVEAGASAFTANTKASNASTSAAAALAHKNAAFTSETRSATSADEASGFAATASTQADNANTAALAASASSATAITKAGNASTFALAALASQNAAADSEASADGSATDANTSASTATTKAGEASSSATASLASKNAAATSATTATTKADNATTSAANSATSEAGSVASAAAASASAGTAATKAAEAVSNAAAAAGSATTSTTQAGNSSTSATASLASQNAASTSAGTASTQAALAAQWATQLTNPVAGGEFSAKYWAQQVASTTTGALVYRGGWPASTGAYPVSPALGDYYKVSADGAVGTAAFLINDSIIYNGASWDKLDSTDQVSSVAGRVGVIVLDKSDVGLGNVDNTTDANKPISSLTATALAGKQASGSYQPAGTYATGTGSAAGANTGDETQSTIKTKLGVTTLSGANTGDQTLPTSLPASDVSPWAKAATKPSYTLAELGAQAVLVSGTNIKTMNGTSLLGGGNLVIDVGSPVTLSGDLSPLAYATTVLTITNFDSATAYSVSATGGTATISGSSITYVAGQTAGTFALTVNAGAATRVLAVTVTLPPSYLATPTATPANFGDSFEGGFYAGQIWNEVVQSATSYTVGAGSKAFTVADMSAAPLVYAGQTLEVRSRANPANKMVGTVTGANGTALTLNITSVTGSGTFTDWSIMAQYRVIVAPKSTGENTSCTYKNDNTAAPTACQTVSEGRKATLAMVAADTATVYPAAHWCNSLSIAGKADWYLPARDELELCWRNLKPGTGNNYLGTRSKSSINYANLGSTDDTSGNKHGVNNNSSPTGAAYTSGSPAQTSVTAFWTGGSEAFAYGSSYYWSASEYLEENAWNQFWVSSVPGVQDYSGKTIARVVRAVRRSII